MSCVRFHGVLPVDCSGAVQQLNVSALHLPFAIGGATLPMAFFAVGVWCVCIIVLFKQLQNVFCSGE